jgi:hypothetical protein
VGALKAEGNECFRKQDFQEACAAYLQVTQVFFCLHAPKRRPLKQRAHARGGTARDTPRVPTGRALPLALNSRGASDQAIRMLDRGELGDAKLYSNMAAAQLALDKFVAAAMYAQKCTEADPAWWKGYW